MSDWKDQKVRADVGGIVSLTSKRLPLIVACATPKCPEKTGVPFDAMRNERSLAKALIEYQGPAYSALGEWGVWPMTVTRTMQAPLKGWTVLCPRCSDAVTRKQNAAAINVLSKKVITEL
jgi:hypothetical protein